MASCGREAQLPLETKSRQATVVLLEWSTVHGAYRVRFRVHFYRRGDQWCLVHTDPPCDVRCTRWLLKAVEVVTPDRPRWQVGDKVTLTLEPY